MIRTHIERIVYLSSVEPKSGSKLHDATHWKVNQNTAKDKGSGHKLGGGGGGGNVLSSFHNIRRLGPFFGGSNFEGVQQTHRTCDFSGGGGVHNTYPPPLDPHIKEKLRVLPSPWSRKKTVRSSSHPPLIQG